MTTNNNMHSNNGANAMENVFDSIPVYGARWQCVECRNFNDKELAGIQSVSIEISEHGLSFCFLMANGKKQYIPADKKSSVNVGDIIDKGRVLLKKLLNVGEPNAPKGSVILRADVVEEDDNVATDFDNPFDL